MKNYCHLCGAKYIEGKSQPWECSGCGNLSYQNSNPCAEIALFNEKGQVLISKRAFDPKKGKYDLPGGFLNLREKVHDGLVREIREELNLGPEDYSKPILVTSWIDDYVFSKEVLVNLSLVFAAKLKTKNISASDDVESFVFVDISELDSVDFSVSDYPEVIRKAYKNIFH